MKLSEIFFGSIVFFALFTMSTGFTTSLFENHGVEDNTSVGIEDDYTDLKQTVKGSNDSLQSKLSTLQQPSSGALDKASAGLLLVPQFFDVLATPMKILTSAVDGIAASYAFIPAGLVTFLKIMIIAAIAFALFSLAVGQRA